VVTNRRAVAEQFLGDDEPVDRAALGAAVPPGQCHAEPAAGAELLRELTGSGAVHAKPGPPGRLTAKLGGEKPADLGLQGQFRGRQIGPVKANAAAFSLGHACSALSPNPLNI
jgi:hypothetical protein